MGKKTVRTSSPHCARIRTSFDQRWRFLKGDCHAAETPRYDDRAWRALDLPHDWSIEGPFSEDNPSCSRGGYLPCGIGWYRKTFALPKEYKGKKVFIEFEGVYMNSDVWINGRHLGRWPYGYTTFEYELTPHLKYGKKANVLAVCVDNSAQPGSRWYTGSGIYRHVWLTVADPLRVAHWGTYIITPIVTDKAAIVQARTTVANGYGRKQRFTCLTAISRKNSRAVAATTESEHEVEANGQIDIHQRLDVASPHLWSCESPNLYEAHTRILLNGKAVDEYVTTFGIRHIQFHPDRGFLLNGKQVKMKGVCLHHDLGALGAAAFDRAIERQVDIMIEMGANAIRTSHNPPAPYLLDYCDRRGVLVMDEAFDEWTIGKKPAIWKEGVRVGQVKMYGYAGYFKEWSERDLRALVQRDRNHPCVVLWSIGNEIPGMGQSGGADTTRRLVAIVHDEDRARPVTAGVNGSQAANESGAMQELDVAGYNYKERFYAREHAQWPARTIVGTETTVCCRRQPRGVYDTPTWFDTDSSYKATEHSMKITMENDYAMGLFIWTGINYIGEPTPEGWPTRSSFVAPVDSCGFRKDGFYFYQSQWTDKPILHLLPHWNWKGKEGQEIPVWCYTNCERVELLLNGRSLGAHEPGRMLDLHLSWRVPYEPGVLKAVGKKDGKTIVCETRTAGEPARLVLEAERRPIAADGRDFLFVAAKVCDKDGLTVPTANNAVTFKVEGKARLVAVDNGDQRDVSGFYKDHINALGGLCLVIAQSARQAGPIKVTATSPGLKSASVAAKARAITE